MHTYTKIETPFVRAEDGSKKLIYEQYRSDAVKYLAENNVTWEWTEKIDGTNIGVVWDGHHVSFQGRTERSSIPAPLVNKLQSIFCTNECEELFEQKFGEKEFILFGEGYGNKIQKVGSQYIKDDVDFILFDVYYPEKDIWLRRDDVDGIADAFGIKSVPIVLMGTLYDAIQYIKSKPQSTIGNALMEGVVGRPECELRDRLGNRVIVKVKAKDFTE